MFALHDCHSYASLSALCLTTESSLGLRYFSVRSRIHGVVIIRMNRVKQYREHTSYLRYKKFNNAHKINLHYRPRIPRHRAKRLRWMQVDLARFLRNCLFMGWIAMRFDIPCLLSWPWPLLLRTCSSYNELSFVRLLSTNISIGLPPGAYKGCSAEITNRAQKAMLLASDQILVMASHMDWRLKWILAFRLPLHQF